MYTLFRIRIISLVIANLILLNGQGQEIIVKDAVSLEPIPYVVIKWQDKGLLTDEQGIADLHIFQRGDSLIFQHHAYESYTTIYDSIEGTSNTLFLDPSFLELSEVVISVNRWEQNSKEVPNRLTRISRSEIQIQQPQTSADLIGSTGEVFIQKSQLGGGSPMIRGFSANRVLIVVDDVRMNNAIFRSGNLQNIISIDPMTISSAEVIFGPGSVVYGSDALGGVMDFHTISPRYSPNEELLLRGNVVSRYASANNEKTVHLDLNVGKRTWSWLGSFSFSDFDDLKMGNNGRSSYLRESYVERINSQDKVIPNEDPLIQRFSGYQQWNLMQKLKIKTGTYWDWEYSFHYSSTSDIPRYDRLIEMANGVPDAAEWYYGPQKWQMHGLGLHYSKNHLWFDQFKAKIAYQKFEESRNDRNFNDPWLRTRTEMVDMLSASVDFTKQFSSQTRWFYGVEFLSNWITSTGEEKNLNTEVIRPVPSRYPTGSTWNSAALYTSINHRPGIKWNLSAGLRYNHIFLQAPFEDTFFDFPFNEINTHTGAFNGSLGWIFTPSKQWQISLNTSSGFRAPNIDDVGKVFDSEPGNVVVPNPSLRPEYAYNIDLSIKYELFEGSQISLTGFYTWLDNALVRRDFTFNGKDSILYDGELSQVQALVNADNAYIYGMHVSVSAALQPWLVLDSHFTFSRGEDKDGFAVRHVAPLFGTTHLKVKWQDVLADIYTIYNGSIPFERLAPSERSKPTIYAKDDEGRPFSPDWYTLNFKAKYQFNDQLGFSLGVENITGQRYRPYSSGIVAPGRNFIVSLSGSI